MSLAPSPSSGRGEILLQPAYFTSSVFVHAVRIDVDDLVREYSKQYTSAHPQVHPYGLFKDIWQRQGWIWIQFKVFDARSRATFLRVVMRLFLGHIGDGETPLTRAAALFGLYTMFHTQPSSAPFLYSAARVELTCDEYQRLLMFPDALDAALLLPIRPHVVYVLSKLVEARAFQVLSYAEVLPREFVGNADTSTVHERKKKGRPSKRDRIKKTRDALAALERRCESADEPPPSATRCRYMANKSALLSVVGEELGLADEAVVERMALLVSQGLK